MSSVRRIERLRSDHAVSAFDCGVPALNRFLQTFALASQKAGSARTYVAMIDDAVAGYHSLTVGDVTYDDAPERMAKGLPHHPVPAMILARLAVDLRFRGQGIGADLLRDALERTIAVAQIAGVRAVIVHAKDDQAKAFYEHFGFVAFPGRSLTLYRLLKDVGSPNR